MRVRRAAHRESSFRRVKPKRVSRPPRNRTVDLVNFSLLNVADANPIGYEVAMPKAKAQPKKKRKLNPALMKPVQPDQTLAAIVGSKPLPRSQLTKKLWDYIKKNKLQDAKKRTMINADDSLRVVFGGKKQVSMFEMTKLVSGHIK
jgi:chromatin remodeling complex protein RSC6